MNKEVLRTIKFTLFSMSAGIIQLLSFTLLNEVIKLPYYACYLIALILSVIWNFTLNRKFTFKSANNIPIAMFKVFLYYLVFTPTSTYLGNYMVSKKVNEYVSTISMMILNFVTEYLFDRFVVFRKSIDTK